MSMRTLMHRGQEWTVWDVVPSLETRRFVPLSASTDAGWLCLQSASEKRRIVPAPTGWEDWTDDRLAREIDAAAVIAPSGVEADRAPSGTAQIRETLRREIAETEQRRRELGGSAAQTTRVADDAQSEGSGQDWVERPPEADEDRL